MKGNQSLMATAIWPVSFKYKLISSIKLNQKAQIAPM